VIIKEDLNLGNLLTNVIKNSENIEEKNTHIMSNISSSEVLAMSDDSHTLKILNITFTYIFYRKNTFLYK